MKPLSEFCIYLLFFLFLFFLFITQVIIKTRTKSKTLLLTEILPNLWVGSASVINKIHDDPNTIPNLHAILNVSNHVQSRVENQLCRSNLECLHLPFSNEVDFPFEFNLCSQLNLAFTFIDSHLKRGNALLVHCEHGRNRSLAIIFYYLMKLEVLEVTTQQDKQKKIDQVLHYLQTKHPKTRLHFSLLQSVINCL